MSVYLLAFAGSYDKNDQIWGKINQKYDFIDKILNTHENDIQDTYVDTLWLQAMPLCLHHKYKTNKLLSYIWLFQTDVNFDFQFCEFQLQKDI